MHWPVALADVLAVPVGAPVSAQPTSTAVCPRPSAVAVACSISGGTASNNARRPTRTSTGPMRALTPRPGRLSNPVTTTGSASAAPRTMAAAMGCSDRASRAAAQPRAWARSTPAPTATSTSSMRASVNVPVLSTTAMSTCSARSRISPPLMMTPSWAPRPVPTMIAVGVANPRAQGQAMMSTATAAVKASVAGWPVASHATNVPRAMTSTAGTNTAATRSTRRCTGAREPWASSTSRTIWARAVSPPTLVASTTRWPLVLTVAPITVSPGPTSTGTGSPVSMLMSRAEWPSTTVPSVATLSPGRTTKRMPTSRASRGISEPSARVAVLAPSSARARRASPERRVARTSNHLPSRISVMITPAVSK